MLFRARDVSALALATWALLPGPAFGDKGAADLAAQTSHVSSLSPVTSLPANLSLSPLTALGSNLTLAAPMRNISPSGAVLSPIGVDRSSVRVEDDQEINLLEGVGAQPSMQQSFPDRIPSFSPGAATDRPPKRAVSRDSASRSDWRAFFDGMQRSAKDSVNLYAIAQSASPADREKIDRILKEARGKRMYVDTNVMIQATKDAAWLRFFAQATNLRITRQVQVESGIYKPSYDQWSPIAQFFRRFFAKKFVPVSSSREDLVASLQSALAETNLSGKDARVVAEIVVACATDKVPCILLTGDVKLASAIKHIRTSPRVTQVLRNITEAQKPKRSAELPMVIVADWKESSSR